MDIFVRVVKDSLGLAVLDICLDPDRWVLDFYCLEEYGECFWLCWLSVWDEFKEQSYKPPRVAASLFVLSTMPPHKMSWKDWRRCELTGAVKTDDATCWGLEEMVRL